MSAKYVILSDGKREFAVVFDPSLGHKDVARGLQVAVQPLGWSKVAGPLSAVAAGFVGDTRRGSESLKLGPRPQDAELIALSTGIKPERTA